jgi:hypothetical protein
MELQVRGNGRVWFSPEDEGAEIRQVRGGFQVVRIGGAGQFAETVAVAATMSMAKTFLRQHIADRKAGVPGA